MSDPMPSRVEIRVRGRVPLADVAPLGLRASVAPAGTVLRGALADRCALHGVLDWLFSQGLELIEVRRLPGHAR